MRELHKKANIDVVSKLALYQQYNVNRRYLIPPFVLLCKHPSSLTREEAKILGFDTTVLISATQQALRASPSNRGLCPLPAGIQEEDIFQALESSLGLEAGSTRKFTEKVAPSSTSGQSDRRAFSHVPFTLTFAMVSPAPPNTNRVNKSKGQGSARSRRFRQEYYHQA